MLIKYKNLVIEQRELAEATVENSTFSAINSVNIEGAMFNAAYGADQTKTGHGIYAEEAGTILDRLAGEQSTVVGRDNAKMVLIKLLMHRPSNANTARRHMLLLIPASKATL